MATTTDGSGRTRVAEGALVSRPTKEQLADEVADQLGIARPEVSDGSSVHSGFLRDIYRELSNRESSGSTAYDVVVEIGDRLGLDRDPWDTSQEAKSGGGSTVTARAYSRILCAIRGVPRCFLVFIDSDSWLHDREAASLVFQRQAGAGLAMLDAGPGSNVAMAVFPAEVTPEGGLYLIVARAKVAQVSSSYRRPPWEVRFADFEFLRPTYVVVEGVWPRAGDLDAVEIAPSEWHRIVASTIAQAPSTTSSAGVQDATRASRFERGAVGLAAGPRGDDWPGVLPAGELADVPLAGATYAETNDGVVPVGSGADLAVSPRRLRALDRLTETTAIEMATVYMASMGWLLEQDFQDAGVGFDLLFRRGADVARAEVKGIRSGSLVFNLTAKEWWRCLTDPSFVVLAVTNALGAAPYVHVVARDRIVLGERVALSYRVVPVS